VRLAEDAEMSVSALNNHLAKLEELRLIHRVRSLDDALGALADHGFTSRVRPARRVAS
jgi:DNA-binding MarR family transcriptional regulator